MKVKLKNSMAGPSGCFPAGAELELSADEAKPLINGGYAVIVGEVKAEPVAEIETAEARTGTRSAAKAKAKAKAKTKAVSKE